MDLELLKCIAVREYRKPDNRPSNEHRTKVKPIPGKAYEKEPPKSKRTSKSKPLKEVSGRTIKEKK